MKFSDKVVQELQNNQHLSIQQIADKTNTSVGYVRIQLSAMEQTGTVMRTDDRVPIHYMLDPKSPTMKHKEAVDSAKKALLTPIGEDENGLLKMIKKTPKDKWATLIPTFEILTEAIRQLDVEQKLVDTL